MDKKTDKEYDVYEDNDDGGHDDDDELEDEDDKKGQKVGDSDKKEKEKDVLSVMQLAQFDPASSRRPKAIDSERIPIEYNPSEVAVSCHISYLMLWTRRNRTTFYDMSFNTLHSSSFSL